MELNDLTYQYTQLMRQAEQATNRKDALECIHKATAVQRALNVLKNMERPN